MRRPVNTLSPIQFRYKIRNQPPTKPNAHTEYELLYFHEVCGCKYSIGGHTFSPKSGDLLIMNGIILHRPHEAKFTNYCRSIIHFDSEFINELSKSPYNIDVLEPFKRFGSQVIEFNASDRQKIEQRLEQLNTLHQCETLVSKHRFQMLFLDLLFIIYQISLNSSQSQDRLINMIKANERQTRQLIRYLEENYMKNIDLQHLEEKMHVNRYYLTKSFKEVTGLTIFQYVMLKRISRAKAKLLLHPDKSVSAIGSEVGFKQPAHFSRAFKKLIGCTPEQFRNYQNRSNVQ